MNADVPGDRKGEEKHAGLGVTRFEALGRQVQDEREAVTGAASKADPESASSNLELEEVEVGGSAERYLPPGN